MYFSARSKRCAPGPTVPRLSTTIVLTSGCEPAFSRRRNFGENRRRYDASSARAIGRFASQLSAVPRVNSRAIWGNQQAGEVHEQPEPAEAEPTAAGQSAPRSAAGWRRAKARSAATGWRPTEAGSAAGTGRSSGRSARRHGPLSSKPTVITDGPAGAAGPFICGIDVYGAVRRMRTRFLFERAGL